MSDVLDLLLILDRLAARLQGPAPLPGEFVGQGVNSQRSIFAGTATATFTSGPFVNPSGRSALFTLNITAASGTTPTLNLLLQGVNHDGVAFTLVAPAQQTGVAGPLLYVVGLGATVTANVNANVPFPAQYQVTHTIGGATPSFTYSLDIELI